MEEKEINLRDLWDIFLGNIWLFVASVIVALALAVAYLVITPSVYKRTASVLIKNDSQGKSIGAAGLQSFEDMGFLNTNIDVNNEIHVITTSKLMETVVERLGLNYSYNMQYNGLGSIQLYNTSPFTVKVDSIYNNSAIIFDFNFIDENRWIISNLKINQIEYDDDIVGEFFKPIDVSPLEGTVISKTIFLNEDNIDLDYTFTKFPIPYIAEAYQEKISAAWRDKESTIIDLSISDTSPQRASDILNTLISAYQESWIYDKNQVTVTTSQFIEERLAVIEQELGIVDSNISNYKSANLLPNLTAVTGISLEESSKNAIQMLELNNQLSMAKYIQEYMQNASTTDQVLPANTGIESATIERQIEQYNSLLLQKENLLQNSSESNPIVADMIKALKSMKNVINLSVNELINTLGIQIENARKVEASNEKILANNPTQEKYLRSAGREQMVKESLYLYLLQKREENELSMAFTAYNTKVLAYAKGSPSPIAPRKMMILLFALILGAALPAAYLFIINALRTVVRTKEDLAGLTIPFIGSIPSLDRKKSFFKPMNEKRPETRVVVDNKSRTVVNESFRIIRSNIDFMSKSDTKCTVIMLTSINPSSGKSFITSNIGICTGLKGSKVLLIDSDFRRATLSKYIDSPKIGISSYLSGAEDCVDNIIVRGKLGENVDVLPVGVVPPNPSELLLLPKFSELIKSLREEYDYIFLDCTPFEILPDASIVEKSCDSTIFVVRAGLLDKRLLPDIEAIYTNKKLKNMSLLLNGVDQGRGGYYGYGKYSYGRYSYGYYGDRK